MIVGLDVGGAHLKAARLDKAGRLAAVGIVPCPLWRGMEYLDMALDAALSDVPANASFAVTMTAELVDLFPDRRTGVTETVTRLTARLGEDRLHIYAGERSFLAPAEIGNATESIASANWRATAEFLAARLGEGLLVDVGSTTTDIVPFAGGRPTARGTDDASRLALDELVYTGVARTPVMAVAGRVPFGGNWIAPMAELFATMADAHRLMGDLPETADLHGPADGGEMSAEGSARRLLRMVGEDLAPSTRGKVPGLARWLAEAQLRQIHAAAARVLSAQDAAAGPIVGAGVGRFVAERLAGRLGLPYRDIGPELSGNAAIAGAAADAAPAVAVARLMQSAHG